MTSDSKNKISSWRKYRESLFLLFLGVGIALEIGFSQLSILGAVTAMTWINVVGIPFLYFAFSLYSAFVLRKGAQVSLRKIRLEESQKTQILRSHAYAAVLELLARAALFLVVSCAFLHVVNLWGWVNNQIGKNIINLFTGDAAIAVTLAVTGSLAFLLCDWLKRKFTLEKTNTNAKGWKEAITKGDAEIEPTPYVMRIITFLLCISVIAMSVLTKTRLQMGVWPDVSVILAFLSFIFYAQTAAIYILKYIKVLHETSTDITDARLSALKQKSRSFSCLAAFSVFAFCALGVLSTTAWPVAGWACTGGALLFGFAGVCFFGSSEGWWKSSSNICSIYDDDSCNSSLLTQHTDMTCMTVQITSGSSSSDSNQPVTGVDSDNTHSFS